MASATIFEDLKADHNRHRDLLSRIESGSGDRAALFEQLRVEISAHAAAEEQTLYATMLADPDLQEEARHSVAEHKEIEDYLTELYALDPADPDWAKTFETMRHRYLHHIEEEEQEMFVEAAEQLPDKVEARLAERFEERREAEAQKAADSDPTEKAERE